MMLEDGTESDMKRSMGKVMYDTKVWFLVTVTDNIWVVNCELLVVTL